MTDTFRKFIQLTKVDEAKREVGGVVTAEVPDKDGECCHYQSTVPYYKAWSDEIAKASRGKNLGNLREMHGLSAAGAGKSIAFLDDDKQIFMTFKVVDQDAWDKCVEGVYTGFSQGGRYIKRWTKDGTTYYTAQPAEISLVDNPCLPSAHFDFVRADGVKELRKFKTGENEMETVQTLALSDAELEKIATRVGEAVEQALSKGVKHLVTETGGKTHLPYTDASGKPNHRLMGAAWAALHGGYRGNEYAGPDKDKAIARLKSVYSSEGMDTPSEKAAKIDAAIVEMLAKHASLPDELLKELESAAEEMFKAEEDLEKLLTASQAEQGETHMEEKTLTKAEADAILEKAHSAAAHMKKMRKAVSDHAAEMSAHFDKLHKILGVEEANKEGDDKPKQEAAVPAGTTSSLIRTAGAEEYVSMGKTADGTEVFKRAETIVTVTPTTAKAETPATIENTTEITEAVTTMTDEEIQKRIDDGIEGGLQQILKALAKDDMAAADLAEEEEDAKDKKDKKTKKVASGLGDRTQLPTIVAGAGPVVKVMPVTKTQDTATEPAVAQSEKVDMGKVLSGDREEALKFMKSVKVTDAVPATVLQPLASRRG